MKNKIKEMTIVALCSVFLIIGAWITVPFAVPFTMQTFVLFLVLFVFGGKLGMLSLLLYIALGLIGIPVFSGFNSGVSALIGPTGGYILGFVVAVVLYMALDSIFPYFKHKDLATSFVSMLACYGCGTAWYMLYVNTTEGFLSGLTLCVIPYIIPDMAKIILANVLSKKLKPMLKIKA